MNKNSLFIQLWKRLLVWIILIPLVVEGGLWMFGFRPYRQVAFSIQAEPSFCFLPHTKLGFSLRPGEYQVTINEKVQYQVSHGNDSLRRVLAQPDGGPSLFLMGCSYTYGMGVADSATFASCLQAQLPDWRVKNYGVPGFGTTQSLLQLQDALAHQEKPEMVVVHYADFHDARNVLSPSYRRNLHMGYERSHPALKDLLPGTKVPYVRQDRVQWVQWDDMYQNWPLRERSASINHLQAMVDRIKEDRLEPQQATRSLLQRMNELCQQAGISFVVAGLTQTPETWAVLTALEKEGITTLDISLDLTNPAFTHAPFDEHPNEKAHRWYAMRLYEFLSKSQ